MSSLVAAILAASVLSGCSAPVQDGSLGSSGGTPSGAGESTPDPSNEGFPTCDEVKKALGSEVANLVEIQESENGISVGSDGPALACSWYTEEVDVSSLNLAEYGSISIGVSHDPEYTEESMESLGWNVQDPAVSAAGAWALKVGGEYNPADQLDITGVQVVRDGVVVVLTSGGVALQDVPQLAGLTNEWALGAGVAVLNITK